MITFSFVSSSFFMCLKHSLMMNSSFPATSSKDDLHRRIGGRCSTNNTKVIFKVFGGNNSEQQKVAKTTTTTDTPPSIPERERPPQVDWQTPGNAWRNHHNDQAHSDNNESNDHQSGIIITQNRNSPSTQRPIFINSQPNVNINTMSGNSINKPTKKTSKFMN